MGYDLEPLRTLESKRRLLEDAVRGSWRIVFEHDPNIASGVPVADGKNLVLQAVVEAPRATGTPALSP
jgi:hypothetical protein